MDGEQTDATGVEGAPDLELRAEFELLQRKATLFERRLAAWEAGLDEVQRRLHVLETRQAEDAPSWRDDVADLRHRVARLERRRQAAAAPAAVAPAAPAPEPPLARAEAAMAIVRARWSVDTAVPGEEVTLLAEVDGIPAGTTLALAVRELETGRTIAHVPARCTADTLRARWRVAPEAAHREVYFEAEFGRARARSTQLVVE